MPLKELKNWLDSRVGYRRVMSHLLDEELPAGTGWWFVTGSVLLVLLAVQVVTGITLGMIYVPAVDHAYDSVRYINEHVTFGAILRGLHYFGASFIVVASLAHLLRVFALGSYKKPREITWIVGVCLLLVIMAFALTGYLLPWDQKAYWATTVTLNIARTAPFGEVVARVLRGGEILGALTLVRWYALHVLVLPVILVGLTLAHLYLMRHHGISGPIAKSTEAPKPFYPYHAAKDSIVAGVVFALLLVFAVLYRAPLESLADPSDTTYIPRPEWYFLGLFQLLKYFPGPLEAVATIVIPGLTVGGLLALPFVFPRQGRRLRDRKLVTAAVVGGLSIAIALTVLGLQDSPQRTSIPPWGAYHVGGHEIVKRSTVCASCHQSDGPAVPLDAIRLERDPEWIGLHLRDPEAIAPGTRTAPPGAMNESSALAAVAYFQRHRLGQQPPSWPAQDVEAASLMAQNCAGCHSLDGVGHSGGPDLTHIGTERDSAWLQRWIAAPEAIDPAANMPGFDRRLRPEQIAIIADYLARKK